MRPRIVLLSVLDPLGRHGLAANVHAAIEHGVDVVPIASGVLDGEVDGPIRRTPARQIGSALRRAFELPVDGMLVGPVHGSWQARAVARELSRSLPDTLVFAPSLGPADSHPTGRAWRILRQAVLPVATVALMPQQQAGALLGGSADADPHDTASAILDAGTHAAWLAGDDGGRRVVDIIASGGQTSVIDYPPTEAGGLVPAARLAALLALGLPLHEAINIAHRAARGLGDPAYIASAR